MATLDPISTDDAWPAVAQAVLQLPALEDEATQAHLRQSRVAPRGHCDAWLAALAPAATALEG
eukprot:11992365-Karenia_brevis.AAC.1